jgi:F-type H+-transporting ATPase subunit b
MEINATILGEMITFVLFILFTMKYVWPPLIKALEDRQKKVADGLAAGQRGEKSLVLARQKASALLVDAKSQSAKMVDGAHAKANQLVDEAKNRGREEGHRLIQNAKAEISREKQQAEEALRKDTINLAMLAAEKIIGASIDRSVHDKMINELIEGI